MKPHHIPVNRLLLFHCFVSIVQVICDHVDGRHIEHIHHVKRRLQNAGFEEFHTSHLRHVSATEGTQSFNASILKERPHVLNLQFNAFGEEHNLTLNPTSSVLHHEAEIFVSNGDSKTTWNGEFPDCFLIGELTSHGGSASFSHCDSLHGGMRTYDHEYHVEEVIAEEHRQGVEKPGNTTLLITRRKHKYSTKSQNQFHTLGAGQPIPHHRHTRSVPSHKVVVELGVYTDSEFTKLFPSTSISKRIELMLLIYNGVQKEWSRSDVLGYNVTFQIKRMQFFDTNPSWYNMSSIISESLASFCAGQKSDKPFDAMFMHTGTETDVTGRAFQSSICNPNYRCGIDSIKSFTQYIATAHEIGHLLGMQHDDVRNCINDTGTMGGYGAGWSHCSVTDMNTFFQSGRGGCVWKTNIPSVQELPVHSELIGQKYTPDEVCEQLHGKGFRYREYPRVGHCNPFSCVNYNPGPKYGQMIAQAYDIPGLYCGDGRICFKRACSTWAKARQTPQEIRAGGWGQWGRWQPCSRSCGSGVTFRRRVCDNPTPKNHPTCTGDAYQAMVCSKRKCLRDSDIEAKLIDQRASETCSNLIKNQVINGSKYLPTGHTYSGYSYGVCEVTCDSKTGRVIPFKRFGLMPHGTPCPGAGILDQWDVEDWPRKPGYHARCLEGYCYKFGCDGVLNGASFDKCGICGGHNTACTVVEGVFSDQIKTGDRKVIARIPVGAYNIQFWFSYFPMKKNFLELYTPEDTLVMALHNTDHSIYATDSNPISYGGTFWHFKYVSQYLMAKGPLTRPAVVKLYKHLNFNNTGIHYAYSLPKSAARCTGFCSNGGTFDRSICSCLCPKGFYGNQCKSRCSTYCFNGAPVDEQTCRCQCNSRQIGDVCECHGNYTGENCNECKEVKCETHKIFNSKSCQCECPRGFTGQDCQSFISTGFGKRKRNRKNRKRGRSGQRRFNRRFTLRPFSETVSRIRSRFPTIFAFFNI